eukprot:8784237-Pyramimonas_sp.AAC.1
MPREVDYGTHDKDTYSSKVRVGPTRENTTTVTSPCQPNADACWVNDTSSRRALTHRGWVREARPSPPTDAAARRARPRKLELMTTYYSRCVLM